MTSGVIKTESNGFFYFYDSVITKNYAKSSAISLIFNSPTDSVFDKCDIFSNSLMDIDEILLEINSMCSKL